MSESIWDEIDIEPEDRMTRAKGEPVFALSATHVAEDGRNRSSSVLHLNIEELKTVQAKSRRILYPTPTELHDVTMDGLVGEVNGDVESPVGWFALVPWVNGRTYLIGRDITGHCYSYGDEPTGSDSQKLGSRYQHMLDAYDKWTDVGENEA